MILFSSIVYILSEMGDYSSSVVSALVSAGVSVLGSSFLDFVGMLMEPSWISSAVYS